MLKIGKISYTNSIPFYLYLPNDKYELIATTPYNLGKLAKDGKIDAGLFSLCNTFEIESEYEPLGKLCIASKMEAKSVFFFSNKKIEQITENEKIFITTETATSSILLKLILLKKNKKKIKREV